MSRIGQGIIDGLQELIEYSEGNIDLKTSRQTISPVCEAISVEAIKETRDKLGMSQGIFAMVLGVSEKTVKSWETGRYMPDGAARRLITMLQSDPELLVKYGIVNR
jgi:putative transcriptional regulator